MADRPDRPETIRFLDALFAPYPPSRAARVELRCFRAGHADRGAAPVRRWFPLDADGRAAAAREAVRLGPAFDVYYTVLPRRDGMGGAAGVRLCAWLWADIDGGDDGPEGAATLLRTACAARSLPAPQIVVLSGGGLHAYWRLAEPVPCRTREEQDQVRRTLRRLVTAIGGTLPGAHADRASAEPARILRLPGTANHKRQTPRPVRLLRLYESAPVQPLVWWRGHLPAEPLPPSHPIRRREARYDATMPPPAIAAKLAGAADGARHDTMRDVAVWARKKGLSEDEIREYAERVGRASGVPMDRSDQQRHLDDLVRWTLTTVQPDYSRI